jgi:hypothetical protein
MILAKADGTKWRIEEANAKLTLRAKLPGARVFDLAAESLRKGRAAGMSVVEQLPLALPASWCVNSPAPSTVFRRWALPPQRDVWPLLIDVLEEPRTGPLDAESTGAVLAALRALGPEAFGVEAISKVLALLVPEAVPLMPAPARAFVLGESAPADASAFVAMVDWFAAAVQEGGAELASWAKAHDDVSLSAAQALDRLLWFDSEGHRHFPSPKPQMQ